MLVHNHQSGSLFNEEDSLMRRGISTNNTARDSQQLCGMSFATPLSLKSRVKERRSGTRRERAGSYFHSLAKSFLCHECGAAFRKRSHLRSHMDKHTDGNTYKCPFCDGSYKHFRSLGRHMLSHKDVEVHKCDRCCQFFKSKEDFTSHECSPKKGSFSCKTCGEFFTAHALLADHIRALHADKFLNFEDSNSADSVLLSTGEQPISGSDIQNKPFVCNDCGTAFQKKGHLRSHADKHTVGKPYTCPVCKVSYKHVRSLSRHMLDHGSETAFRCEMCKVFFQARGELSNHVCATSNLKAFHCELCGASFAEPGALESHGKLHADEILVFQNL